MEGIVETREYFFFSHTRLFLNHTRLICLFICKEVSYPIQKMDILCIKHLTNNFILCRLYI